MRAISPLSTRRELIFIPSHTGPDSGPDYAHVWQSLELFGTQLLTVAEPFMRGQSRPIDFQLLGEFSRVDQVRPSDTLSRTLLVAHSFDPSDPRRARHSPHHFRSRPPYKMDVGPGLDVLADDSGGVHVLEVNAPPVSRDLKGPVGYASDS